MASDEPDMFLRPVCRPDTLDIYHSRRGILRALEEGLESMSGTLLDVGCGNMPYREFVTRAPSRVDRYIGLDLADDTRYGAKADIEWDGTTIPLSDASVDCALAVEVLEHCPDRVQVLGEVARVLRPGGALFATVPFLYPLHDVPNDEGRPTPFALQRELEKAGFDVEKLESLGGWDQSLAQMIGLWVRRRPMGRLRRGPLSWLAWPVVHLLLRQTWQPSVFGENQMLTGISVLARKKP